MIGDKTVAVVVPAHNEARLIERTVASIPDYADHIIVVDDASVDETPNILKSIRESRLSVVRHPHNKGVGGAIVTGYKEALAIGVDMAAVMAGDNQMDPSDLLFLIEPVIKGTCDYAKGDRLSWPGVFRRMPLLRFFGNHVLSQLTRITSGFNHVRDSQCGYTVVSAEILAQMDLDALWPRYGFPNDMLAKVHAAKGRIANVPVRPIYADEVSGISLTTAFCRVPMVLLRSFIWRIKTERKRFGQLPGPVKSLDA